MIIQENQSKTVKMNLDSEKKRKTNKKRLDAIYGTIKLQCINRF